MSIDELPDFLPLKLNLSGKSWEDILNEIYTAFERDFKLHKVQHFDTDVDFDRRILPDGQEKEEGFWHIVEREDKDLQDRSFDIERAERLPWIRAILESDENEDVLVFDYDHGAKDKGIRRYVWLKKHDFVVILKAKEEIFYLITAFYIDSKWKRKDFQDKYNKRLGS